MKHSLLRGLTVVLFAPALLGQTATGDVLRNADRPDLSGAWTVIAGRATGPAPSFGADFSIRQTPDVIELTLGRSSKASYRLDGSESRNTAGTTVTTSRANWDGDKLVIVTTASPGTSVHRTLSLDASGDLVVETAFERPTNPMTMTTYYRRAAHKVPSTSAPLGQWQIRSVGGDRDMSGSLSLGLVAGNLVCTLTGKVNTSGRPAATCDFTNNTLKFSYNQAGARGGRGTRIEYSGKLQPNGELAGSVSVSLLDAFPSDTWTGRWTATHR